MRRLLHRLNDSSGSAADPRGLEHLLLGRGHHPGRGYLASSSSPGRSFKTRRMPGSRGRRDVPREPGARPGSIRGARRVISAKKNKAYNDSPTKPVDSGPEQVEATAITEPGADRYGTVHLRSTRAVVLAVLHAMPSWAAMPRDRPDKQGQRGRARGGARRRLVHVQCLKPWSIPDVMGRPDRVAWAARGRVTASATARSFTDLNGNGFWDLGEAFDDGTNTAKVSRTVPGRPAHMSRTCYDPVLTGYWRGTRPRASSSRSRPGNRATSRGRASTSRSTCPGHHERGRRLSLEHRQLQPDAGRSRTAGHDRDRTHGGSDDPGHARSNRQGSGRLLGRRLPVRESSQFATSPRIVFIPMHDPRIAISVSGKHEITIMQDRGFLHRVAEGQRRRDGPLRSRAVAGRRDLSSGAAEPGLRIHAHADRSLAGQALRRPARAPRLSRRGGAAPTRSRKRRQRSESHGRTDGQ